MTILNRVIAIRHGEYKGEDLTDQGREQITRLAKELRRVIPDDAGIVVVSSPYVRARQSAEILRDILGATIESHSDFGYGQYKHGSLMASDIEDLFSDSLVVVAVTHSLAPSGIINAFANRFGKVMLPVECCHGNGHMINLVTGDITENILPR